MAGPVEKITFFAASLIQEKYYRGCNLTGPIQLHVVFGSCKGSDPDALDFFSN